MNKEENLEHKIIFYNEKSSFSIEFAPYLVQLQ